MLPGSEVVTSPRPIATCAPFQRESHLTTDECDQLVKPKTCSAMADNQLQFLSLPPEIREQIYSLILNPGASRVYEDDEYTSYDYQDALVLFRINRQIYYESRKIFRDLNIFVRIETPWPQAKEHVAAEGHVPIVMEDAAADRFEGFSMAVVIDAPQHVMVGMESVPFVIMLDDLPKFTRSWFYADLSHPGMNSNLRLTLRLNAPFTPDWEEKRLMKPLQRRLLLPFGEIKGLLDTRLEGGLKPYGSIEQELRDKQAEKHKPPEHCLAEAARLKVAGNAALQAGQYHAAIELYNKAWEAIHIVIRGQQRHVYADEYFARLLSEEPYKNKNGQAERLTLRIELVANTCFAYLKLQDYAQCRFWGMRTICMAREAMGLEGHNLRPEEEAVGNFPAAAQFGKIYYRTATACKVLDQKTEAKHLFRVAKVYLPGDRENIDKEIAACSFRLW